MPVVICLLNSYSGLAACASGFVISNNVLIVSGSLVGASGIILTNIMCKAMNRSLANVLFGGLGTAGGTTSEAIQGEAKTITPEDAYYILEAADSVVFVPGYGMAVAQAQHVVRELGDILEQNGRGFFHQCLVKQEGDGCHFLIPVDFLANGFQLTDFFNRQQPIPKILMHDMPPFDKNIVL